MRRSPAEQLEHERLVAIQRDEWRRKVHIGEIDGFEMNEEGVVTRVDVPIKMTHVEFSVVIDPTAVRRLTRMGQERTDVTDA